MCHGVGIWWAKRNQLRRKFSYVCKIFNGDYYDGQWLFDETKEADDGRFCFDGHGIYLNTSGHSAGLVYEGNFKDNMCHGKGKSFWIPDCEVWRRNLDSRPDVAFGGRPFTYTGEFKEDAKHGKGVCVMKDGSAYDTEWKYGKLLKSSLRSSSSSRSEAAAVSAPRQARPQSSSSAAVAAPAPPVPSRKRSRNQPSSSDTQYSDDTHHVEDIAAEDSLVATRVRAAPSVSSGSGGKALRSGRSHGPEVSSSPLPHAPVRSGERVKSSVALDSYAVVPGEEEEVGAQLHY
jgi:hypothetical protein